jgi:hypothetical protein
MSEVHTCLEPIGIDECVRLLAEHHLGAWRSSSTTNP